MNKANRAMYVLTLSLTARCSHHAASRAHLHLYLRLRFLCNVHSTRLQFDQSHLALSASLRSLLRLFPLHITSHHSRSRAHLLLPSSLGLCKLQALVLVLVLIQFNLQTTKPHEGFSLTCHFCAAFLSIHLPTATEG